MSSGLKQLTLRWPKIHIAGGLVWVCLHFSLSAVAEIPRTADGRPDLTGTYNVATLTPLERPREFGDSLYLSPEKARELAAAAAALKAADQQHSDPDREAPPEGGDGSAGAAGNVGGYNAFWIDNGEAAMMVDGKFRTSIITKPENGRRPELTEAGRKRMMAFFGLFGKNTGTAWWVGREGPGPYDHMEMRPLGERCLLGFSSTGGPPMLPALYNNMKRIVQTADAIMIQAEMIHDARVIRMNAAHRPPHIRTWMGDSVGHWEGDTLVVDTTNFKSRPALYGATDSLRVVERFTRKSDGDLHYEFTVEDLTVWQQPWRGEYTWPVSDDKVYEYACHEGNYALGNIMRGARLLEQDAAGQAASGR